ncbi:hypothetical protein G3A49_13555 [Haloferax volcanii]|uniref:Restriction endonuclease n=1 Tax=Haloferax volcanii TaxID=2246 RepID=A0A6C0UU71_HALVO|nr:MULTISPECIES: hypothetical protein [Haloferax]MBC9987991.1 hypothetical protein [Haloferax sp. AS1]QIB79095.1 hypothetical protein G3A49_13555 [Haloferax alexandrinus]
MSVLDTREIDLPEGVSGPLIENSSGDQNRLGPEFNPGVLPDNYQNYLTLELDGRGGYVANTGPYVGIIPCKDDTFLPIKPKTEISNLTYFLRESGRMAHELDSPFDEDVPYQTIVDKLTGMHELFIRQLLNQLDRVKRNGLLKERVSEDVVLPRVEGRVNARNYARNVYRGRARAIPQTKSTQTVNNLPNQFLKFTLRKLVDAHFVDIEQDEIAHRLDYFRPVKSLDRSVDFREVKDVIRRAVEERDLPPSRSYYLAPLQLALLIIDQADITLDEEVEDEFQSFMFKMHEAFEDYIRNIVGDHLDERGYNVFNGEGTSHSIDLYDSRSTDVRKLEPDIVISKGTKDVGVIDVKYKDELSNNDHYQLWTYKRQYDVDYAAFISIPQPPQQGARKEYYNRKKFDEKISNFRFWMGDFEESETALFGFLDELIGY